MAKDSLFETTLSKRDALIQEYHSKREVDTTRDFPTMPDFPTTDAILDEARKLKSFVDNE